MNLYPYACGLLEGVKEYYLPKKQTKISAFLLHQTCEKLYNCILMVFTNYRPKSHKHQRTWWDGETFFYGIN